MCPSKQELRAQIRLRKRAMSLEEIQQRSQVLCELFLQSDAYRKADTIYGYLPFNQEVNTLPLLRQALLDGKKVALPKCYGKDMRFIYITDLSSVQASPFGAPEPVDDTPVARDETALVLVPGLAFDREGYRLGYGGGFYDRFLAKEPNHPTIALCYDFQLVSNFQTDPHDIPVSIVLHA